MAMDIIYKSETKFDDDNNFSIDLTSNNEIQEIFFKEKEECLFTGLNLIIKRFEDNNGYKQVKQVCDLINKTKNEQKNNIRHGEIETKLPNFHYFDADSLICTNSPEDKTYEYYNADTKKMDTIKFPDYKKWYKENKAVWNSYNYGKAQFKL